jgi:hypothetical protein
MSQQPIQLKAGLQFRSKTFAATAEIVRIDEKTDTITVLMISSEDHARELEWPLQATKDHFKQGFYFIPRSIPNDVTIW